MTIIQFFKIVFGVSQKETQDLTQQSNLDIANAQPASEEYVATEEEPLSPVEEQSKADSSDILVVNEQEPVHATTDELHEFINEIDKEYSSENHNPKVTTADGGHPEVVEPKPDKMTSLLDNSPYISLADSCCELVKELEKLKTMENQELIDQVISRIKEGLISSGAEPIAEETSYDVIRHAAIGKSIVRKGTPIISTIEPGVVIDDKVMLKAKVQI